MADESETLGDMTPFTGRSSEFHDSVWLAAEDLVGLGNVHVEITEVMNHRNVVFQGGRTVPRVLSLQFKGDSRRLVVNNTNRKTLVWLFRTNKAPEWIGKRVTLFVTEVPAVGGGKTLGIIVRRELPNQQPVRPVRPVRTERRK